ncbi:50S ribosomal protein L4 [Candidatus Nanohalobium constans]|uniref:50S ribosomal protein L4 n=1 Tax=Candidatus Nanohalobium constans TaxID=2565781 RepID=A0A5Q0UH74_9ARCH|nr:50S ribosomal protein L4 [Candidatus Nanohalobium constans]QGA80988.1 50S ribosomal protein L4 [Candidatus Nanohalobium constans]
MTDLPNQFNERVRPDIIKRANLSIKSKKRQQYGADPEAGLRHVVYWKKQQNAYRGQKGKGMSRTPRKIRVRRGSQIYGDGAEAPNTVGGRTAHPPKSQKDFTEEINDKERRKAIRSAIAATADEELVSEKHDYEGDLPLVEEDLSGIQKTQELKETLEDLGLEDELDRVSEKKVRGGMGANRGRKYVRKVGPLVVTAEDEGISDAASNLAGVEHSKVDQLNAEKLAPGATPGRLTVWSTKAVEKLEEDGMYQ